MSSIFTTLKLVNSLSGSEKKHFKLLAGKQKEESEYMRLFDIIETSSVTDPLEVTKQFLIQSPGASIDNASRYLIKLITDSLIQTKIEKDNLFDLMHRLMRVKILQERSLTEEAYHELKRIKKKAESSQNHLIQYITCRYELNHLSNIGFSGLTDSTLVEMQMKARQSLRMLNHIEGHYSLYEQLKYRLINHGGIISDEDRVKLNDLLLSEISLVTGKVKNSFESRKLHLLFQSFFFTHIGDHKSALKTFHELNELFELNPTRQESPPVDYFSSLDGILDSLRSTRNYEHMPFYIEKMRSIDVASCPDHFRLLIQKTIVIYSLVLMIEQKDFTGAIANIKASEPNLLAAYHLINIEKTWELYFYCSLAHFGKKEYKKALKFIRKIVLQNPAHAFLPIYKTAQLLNFIICYELNDTIFLSYEIRSYKRFFGQKIKSLKIEKLIFKVIQLDPYHNSSAKNRSLIPKINALCKVIKEDKYESALLKHFDFMRWAQTKFT